MTEQISDLQGAVMEERDVTTKDGIRALLWF
jgi:hypothetical protein